MWTRQSARHLQGVSWGSWEGNQGSAAPRVVGTWPRTGELSPGSRHAPLCPPVPPARLCVSQERHHHSFLTHSFLTHSFAGGGVLLSSCRADRRTRGLTDPSWDVGTSLLLALQREGQGLGPLQPVPSWGSASASGHDGVLTTSQHHVGFLSPSGTRPRAHICLPSLLGPSTELTRGRCKLSMWLARGGLVVCGEVPPQAGWLT